MTAKKYRLITFDSVQAPNFLLTPIELEKYLEFTIKRIYFISNSTDQTKTGAHCHIDAEEEMFVLIKGQCTAVLDDGHGLEEISLTKQFQGLIVPNFVWHHFKNLSANIVILALSSTNYDPSRKGYCEDYQVFKKLIST